MKILLFIILVALAASAQAERISGRVVQVKDGDTVVVRDRSGQMMTIRLAGIDAPEKDQACGMKAKKALADLAMGLHVEVQSEKSDKYGRTVGKLLADGVDLNLAQLKLGYGWHYKKYEAEQPEEDRMAYAEAEVKARAAMAGLWGCGSAIPPWEWRHRDRGDSGASAAAPKRKACFSDNPASCNGDIKPVVSGAHDYYERAASESAYTPSNSMERLPDGGYRIHTGPRGGQFHYSITGKKVYQKK